VLKALSAKSTSLLESVREVKPLLNQIGWEGGTTRSNVLKYCSSTSCLKHLIWVKGRGNLHKKLLKVMCLYLLLST
jgi:hypothetical protein